MGAGCLHFVGTATAQVSVALLYDLGQVVARLGEGHRIMEAHTLACQRYTADVCLTMEWVLRAGKECIMNDLGYSLLSYNAIKHSDLVLHQYSCLCQLRLRLFLLLRPPWRSWTWMAWLLCWTIGLRRIFAPTLPHPGQQWYLPPLNHP
jgi:hypothetical protein